MPLTHNAENTWNRQESDEEQSATHQKQADEHGESRQDIHFPITGVIAEPSGSLSRMKMYHSTRQREVKSQREHHLRVVF
jgi:hypothetical protein